MEPALPFHRFGLRTKPPSGLDSVGHSVTASLPRQEHGTGAADASQSEGHESTLAARVASQSQTETPTQVRRHAFRDHVGFGGLLTVPVAFLQSFKRKPGRADNKRSIGDHSEQVKKRLRTVEEEEEEAGPDSRERGGQQESDLYQHVKEEETGYDTQTYGQR